MAESMEGDLGRQVLQAVQGLSEQVTGLSVRMDKLEARMDKQEKWAERLGIEIMQTREEVQNARDGMRTELKVEIQKARDDMRTELHLGLRQMSDRIDRNNDSLILMVSGLRQMMTERFDATEQRLRALEIR